METTMNKIELTGYVGKNPEIKTLNNGKTMVSLSVATSESYKNQNGEWISNTTWHNVVMWKAFDASAQDEVKKGSLVAVIGKLSNRKYVDKNGQNRYITEVIANSIEPVKKA